MSGVVRASASDLGVTPARRARWVPLAAILLVLGLLLRIRAVGVDGLWMDEIFGASFANLGWLDLVVAVLRFDIHPPMYYLQLKLWSLAGAGDAWLLANSVAWSLATMAVATLAVRSLRGPRAALLTLGGVALAGSEIYFAGEVRMYAMLSCLVVLGWFLNMRWAERPDARHAAMLVLVTGLLSMLHSAAFLPISCLLFHALAERWAIEGSRAFWRWLLPAGLAALLLAPWLLNASMRSVSHTARPDLALMVQTVSGWVLGYGALDLPPGLRAGVAALIVVGMMAVWMRGGAQARRVLLWLVVWPFAAQAVISLLLRPIWLDRTLCFCAPMLAVAAGLACSEHAPRRAAWSAAGGLALLAAAVAVAAVSWRQAELPRKMQYRELARYLEQANPQHLPIHAPVNVTFWAMARYLGGPRWGSLLAVQDSVQADESQAWARIYQRLGEDRLRMLGLLPQARSIASPAGTLWIGSTPLPATVLAGGYWKVGEPSLAGLAEACGGAPVMAAQRLRGVSAVHCGPAY